MVAERIFDILSTNGMARVLPLSFTAVPLVRIMIRQHVPWWLPQALARTSDIYTKFEVGMIRISGQSLVSTVVEG